LVALVSCGGESATVERALAERAAHLDESQRSQIARALVRAGREFEIDPWLLLAVAEEETRVRPGARSKRGALGLMQIRPATAREVAQRHGIAWRAEDQLFDPAFNARIGAAYLSRLHGRFGNWDLALTAYNRGPSKARKLRGREPSSRYSARVLQRLEQLEPFR
jgi:soluble lytic murein transglycosylase